jgi:acetyl-CoA carboxylase biotin carboxylase subunit
MGKAPFQKVLVANRGEIAVRIIRACHEMGMQAVAVFSDADETALHVQIADEAARIGPAPSTESYLRIDRIIEAARNHGVEAIHPGYGFLSERAAFPDACKEAGITFVGPTGDVMRRMGDKLSAREIAKSGDVPIVPGSDGPVASAEEAQQIAGDIGYPVILKASAGGGGKGMRLVRKASELKSSFDMASSEAGAAFGDPTIYIEKYIEQPRHIEIQIMADQHGNVVHLGERECSVQRRHQKLIEETPSAVVDDDLRERIGNSAVQVAKGCGYTNAGTVEFMLDSNRNYYFLEMNTRLQVEHPVTELVTGLDLVKEQFRVAAGIPLSFGQEEIVRSGSAIEVRIYAEDADNNYAPSPGTVSHLLWPGGPGVRVDGGIYDGYKVPLEYDPLLAKLCVWAENREEAIKRMQRALRETRIGGIVTSAAFARRILAHPDFISGNYDTHFLDLKKEELPRREDFDDSIIAALSTEIYQESQNGLKSSGGSISSKWKLIGRLAGLFGGKV